MSRTVSILPNSDPRILKPVETPFGTMQVRWIEQIDAHGLFLHWEKGETLLVTHHNGYSCFNLLERMVAGDAERIKAQAQYIIDCGGTSRNLDHIVGYVLVEEEARDKKSDTVKTARKSSSARRTGSSARV